MESENRPQCGTNPQEAKSEELNLQGSSDRFQPIDEMMDDRSPQRFLVDRRELHSSSSRRTSSSAPRAEGRIILNTTRYIDVVRTTRTTLDVLQQS